jgi:RNA-directed DNA polymerase
LVKDVTSTIHAGKRNDGGRKPAGAPARPPKSVDPRWQDIDWPQVYREVRRLQQRIAKAMQEGKPGKARALQWLLTHSWYAKLLAVKRVTTNKGKRTPGVDGVLWTTHDEKLQAAHDLRRRGYRAQPLRRIHIPKGPGKTRPLGIPTLRDRAMQAVHLLALAPVAETTADPNSYGFREYRGTADAIAQGFICLGRRQSSTWILEGDIRACFDHISHEWVRDHVLIDRQVLHQFLKAGFIWKGHLFPTTAGTPQGGIISACLANMVLDGLEPVIRKAAAPSPTHLIRYADDFLVVAKDATVLNDRVMPAITAFLQPRGLALSEEKTVITSVYAGVDFLGQHVRKYGGQQKLLITPAAKNVRRFLANVKKLIDTSYHLPREELVKRLNAKIRGWANFHRHICAKRTFSQVDYQIGVLLLRRERRMNPKMGRRDMYRRYFIHGPYGGARKVVPQGAYAGERRLLAAHTPIVRHVKVRCAANPYASEDEAYFAARRKRRRYQDETVSQSTERLLAE